MLLRDSRLLTANRQIRSEVGQAFNTLLHLVREASLYYVIRLRTPTRQISSDFNEIFGEQVTAFHRRKNHIIDAMWQHSLGDEATTQIRTLRKWLGPRDSTLQKFLKSDCMAPGDRNEFTCEWFQSHLLAFSRSKNDVLAIHGSAGCGKSVLSNWIVERLQRPLGRKVYVTLSCPIGKSRGFIKWTSSHVRPWRLQILGNRSFIGGTGDVLSKLHCESILGEPCATMLSYFSNIFHSHFPGWGG